jgi:hypothetical protein
MRILVVILIILVAATDGNLIAVVATHHVCSNKIL